jgi:hypothetical protein
MLNFSAAPSTRLTPGISAIFAHADHTAIETGAGDGLLAAALAATLPDGARLVFSMGCHTGLAISDATVGGGAASADLPATLTARGAAYVATTGYGYVFTVRPLSLAAILMLLLLD